MYIFIKYITVGSSPVIAFRAGTTEFPLIGLNSYGGGGRVGKPYL